MGIDIGEDMNAIAIDIIKTHFRLENISYDRFYFTLEDGLYIVNVEDKGVITKWRDRFDANHFDIETNVDIY